MVVREFINMIGFKVNYQQLLTAEDMVKNRVSRMSAHLNTIGQNAGNIMAVGGVLTAGITLPIIGLGKAAITAAMTMEDLQVSLETLLGSKEKAAALKNELVAMAAATPFETTDLAQSTSMLLSYGIAQDEIIARMRNLGDISLGNKEKFNRLTLAFGQISAKGRLMGQEVLQMTENGFNPLQEISRTTGISMAVLTKKMEAGGISVDMVRQALVSATSAGGRFADGMKRASGTMSGLWSTVSDSINMALATIGEQFSDQIKSIERFAIKLAGVLGDVAKAFGSLPSPVKLGIAVLAGILAVMGPLTLAIGAIAAMMPSAIAGFVALNSVLGIFTIVEAGATAGAIAFNMAWLWIPLTIAAVGVALYLLIKYFDDIVEAVDWSLNKIVEGFAWLGKILLGSVVWVFAKIKDYIVWSMKTSLSGFVWLYNKVYTMIKIFVLLHKIAYALIATYVMQKLKRIWGWFAWLYDTIAGFLSRSYHKVVNYWSDVIKGWVVSIKAGYRSVIDAVKRIANDVWDILVAPFRWMETAANFVGQTLGFSDIGVNVAAKTTTNSIAKTAGKTFVTNVNSNITTSVPEGTSEVQKQYLQAYAKNAVRKEWSLVVNNGYVNTGMGVQ